MLPLHTVFQIDFSACLWSLNKSASFVWLCFLIITGRKSEEREKIQTVRLVSAISLSCASLFWPPEHSLTKHSPISSALCRTKHQQNSKINNYLPFKIGVCSLPPIHLCSLIIFLSWNYCGIQAKQFLKLSIKLRAVVHVKFKIIHHNIQSSFCLWI